jgi:hypothetical protein
MAIEFYDVITNIPCYNQDNFMVDSGGDVYEWVGESYDADPLLILNNDISWRVV